VSQAPPGQDAAAWDARYAAATTPVWHTEPNVWVREAVADLPPGRALDVAAGEGRHAVWLARHHWRVDALDISRVGLARGAELATGAGVADRVTWTVADVVTSPPAPSTYDLAVVAYLHLAAEPLRTALTGTLAAVRPGGRLVVVGHARSNLTDGVGGPQDPGVLYEAGEVAAHLEAAGARVLRAERRERAVAGAPRPALDVVLVATRD
jgi:SAM-dependent methyltransferase